MYETLKPVLQQELAEIEKAGLYKKERIIISPQGAEIEVEGGKKVINFCANNYLGLSSNPKVIEAAKATIDAHGYGMSSVRFICGTQDIHKELKEKYPSFWVQKTPYCMLRPSMQTVEFLNHCLTSRMRLFLTSLTTPPSLTAFVCARPSVCGISTMTWPTWKKS